MRKTNIFYLSGNNSKFLTFSNYGEYLTGVALSTNNKIYPSAFICANLNFDKEHTLYDLKKTLMCYYENKLAYLRDDCESQNILYENQVPALPYLIETLYMYFGKENVEFVYYGDIVEHDYNGSYNDSICIVDFNRPYTNFNINMERNYEANELVSSYKNAQNTNVNINLHNWKLGELPNDIMAMYNVNDDNVVYDENKYFINYSKDTNVKSIDISIDESKINLEFNCVIPLFDINDLNYKTNNAHITENTIKHTDISLYNSESVDEYSIYRFIPYGIWFVDYDDENILNKKISLSKIDNNISQSWSLVISSKFTPTPFGVNIDDDKIDFHNIDFEKYTYSQLLSEHSKLLLEFHNTLLLLNKISSDYEEMKMKFNALTTLDMDNMKLYMNNVETNMKTYVDNKLSIIEERLNDLKWKSIKSV